MARCARLLVVLQHLFPLQSLRALLSCPCVETAHIYMLLPGLLPCVCLCMCALLCLWGRQPGLAEEGGLGAVCASYSKTCLLHHETFLHPGRLCLPPSTGNIYPSFHDGVAAYLSLLWPACTVPQYLAFILGWRHHFILGEKGCCSGLVACCCNLLPWEAAAQLYMSAFRLFGEPAPCLLVFRTDFLCVSLYCSLCSVCLQTPFHLMPQFLGSPLPHL